MQRRRVPHLPLRSEPQVRGNSSLRGRGRLLLLMLQLVVVRTQRALVARRLLRLVVRAVLLRPRRRALDRHPKVRECMHAHACTEHIAACKMRRCACSSQLLAFSLSLSDSASDEYEEKESPSKKAAVLESEDDIEADDSVDDDDDSTFIADEDEGDDDVTDIIGDVGGDEES